MKTLLLLAMVATLGMVVSADGVPTVVTYVPNSKVTEVMTKGGEIVNDKGLIILANRRSSRAGAWLAPRTPRPVRFGQRVSTAARRTS